MRVFLFSAIVLLACLCRPAVASTSLHGIISRPDLPQRAGHGFFMKKQYVTDNDLWNTLGPYLSSHSHSSGHASSPPATAHTHDGLGSHTESEPLFMQHHTSPDFTHSTYCCMAMIASCLACQNDQSVTEYCVHHPFVEGCNGESVVLLENEVCYEHCPNGLKINYPDKCGEGLICAPFSVELMDGGGCGLKAYTCQYHDVFTPETVAHHEASVADHMLTHFVLGDDWITAEVEMMWDEMSVCEKIDYKVSKNARECTLDLKYLYRSKGCCPHYPEGFVGDTSAVIYVLLGACACCCFMTCAAAGGCAEMQRRRANRMERRMERLLSNKTYKEEGILQKYLECKEQRSIVEEQHRQRYMELQRHVHGGDASLRYPLLYNEIL